MQGVALRLALVCAMSILGACAGLPNNKPVADPAGSQVPRAQALFEAYWEEVARQYPEGATYRGDHRYGDRFTDRSPDGIAANDRYWQSLLRSLEAIDRTALDKQTRLSLKILRGTAADQVALQAFAGLRSMTVNASPFPFQTSFASLLRSSPVASAEQVEQMLARMTAYPARMDQEIGVLERGLALGWVPPRATLDEVLRQLDKQLATPIDKSAYYEPFTKLGSGIDPTTQQSLRSRALQATEKDIYPATRRLRDFVAGDYFAAAPDEGGMTRYPGGKEAYTLLVRIQTTTSLTPDQIHDIGLGKVVALRREIETTMQEAGFKGTFREFVTFLNSDPQFFFTSGEQLLAGYRDILKRVDPELPRLFAELPRATYGVRAMPDFMGLGAAEYYYSPSLDGMRPGWFSANAAAYATKPKWGMESIAAHEGVPGHHLQWARAVELKGLPPFRRTASFTAFSEGWALYAETLGTELNLYRDPYSRFGFLQNQIWRAARLVVDTGIHAKGWTRKQAIEYLAEVTGFDLPKVASEVDRYISDPGQALGYMIGQLKISGLREQASKALGSRFDLRRFHMVILDSGQLPLEVLEDVVNEWIAAESQEPQIRK